MPLEVERKYLNVDFATLRRALHDLGAAGFDWLMRASWNNSPLQYPSLKAVQSLRIHFRAFSKL